MQSRTTDTEMNNHKTGSSGATFTILNYPRNPSLDPSVNSGQKILFRNSASFLEKKSTLIFLIQSQYSIYEGFVVYFLSSVCSLLL